MQHLILRPGPQLVMRDFRPEPDDVGGRRGEVDVTGRAHELLFELITVHAGTTLADIFRLMEASPLLQKFYRRDFAEELCAEARKGAVEPPARERAPHEGIEFLELYQQWGLNTSTNEYSGTQRLQLHGIGYELAEDLPEERRKKGERIEWSVSLTPLRELLPMPVRVSAEVRITEEDATAKAYMSEIRCARSADVTLGQVIHGLLWELSFHGFVVTSGRFTDEAVAFANGRNVNLVDGTKLHGLIRQAKAGIGRSPARAAAEAAPAVPPSPAPMQAASCPLCSKPMVRRTAKRGANAGSEFWGCTGYPACRGTRPVA